MIPFLNNMLLRQQTVKAKSLLIKEGARADEIFILHSGSARAWFNNSGKELTLQFFFENDAVTSLESFLEGTPSMINVETIDPCNVSVLDRAVFLQSLETDTALKEWFLDTAIKKLISHTSRLLFLLKNKPYDRYQSLLADNPEIMQKVPHHYIASYLGMTPVSLSRIRSRSR